MTISECLHSLFFSYRMARGEPPFWRLSIRLHPDLLSLEQYIGQ